MGSHPGRTQMRTARSPCAPRAGKEDIEAYCLRVVGLSPNLLVPHYLMHCWLYYVKDHSVISDAAFETLTAALEKRWADLVHPDKDCIDPSLLKTGYYLEYPTRVPYA